MDEDVEFETQKGWRAGDAAPLRTWVGVLRQRFKGVA
jgi:hypothetical protein